MAQFKVDDFLIELSFNSQKVLKGLEKAEKQTMQVASRIEKRLNKAFKVNPTPLNDSLKVMERNVDKTVSKIEQRLKNTRVFKIKTEIEDTLKPLRQPRQPRISGNRAITAAYSANMSKLKGFDPILQKYIKSQFYGLSAKAGQMDNSKFNEKLAQLNASVREAIAKARGHTSTSINGDRAASSLDNLSSAAVKTAGAFISMQAVLASYQKIMEVGLQRASSERSIDFVFGDQSTQVKKFIQDLTQITGMDTTETQAQFASFGASATTTMGLEGSEELFKNLTGYARLMGRSDEQIQRALTAVSQMASKGQVMAEELKGQLSEALPGATQAFAKALGLTEKQLFDKMKNGDVKASDALPKFAKELGSQIDSRGGWKAIQDSTQTMLGNLRNTWNNSLTDIFRGSEDGLQDFTRSLTTLLNSLGGSDKTLGESLGGLMSDMSHGVDSLTDISYRVRAFFDEVTLAYRGLTDEQKKVVDALGSGLINSLKVLAGVIAVNKVVGVTRSIYGLMTAITRLGQVADTTADSVNRKNGKPSRLNPMNMLLAGSAIYAGYERLASTPERMEAQAKLPELAKESGLKPVFTMDDVKGWFNSAAMNLANFQEPMNNFVNNTQSTPPAITGDIVNSNAQLAMAVSELGRKVDALTAEAKKPLSVNITGEATVRPDEPAFFTFNQSANDQFTQDMLLSSSYPEEE
ncbi:phage tail tape measure protein [Escherichia coli]|uniref:tape measure protein n=1 Tax=Escherichia coli TaxID=562 RepID=UPI000DA54B58|nr:tape measure protein [Escherichia coli]SQK01685.1 phage tail tape measure protein [Escherichia coli]SQN58136.1 phage tail tape measure protein [Escherichia coli]HAN1246235.1 tape measure protein [Escherichia coli]HCO5586782.1 tape measure protein [Escherichia coli]HCO7135184.1 tape measure protein [Escherichia coli]